MPNIKRMAAQTVAEIRRRDRLEDYGFTNLTGGDLNYLANLDFKDILEDVNRLALKNPIASRIIKAKTNYVVGDGMTFKAKEEEVQKVLDTYWEWNEWDRKFETRVNDLSINGESVFLVKEVTKLANNVIINNLYPGRIGKRMGEEFDDQMTAFTIGDTEKVWKTMKKTPDEKFKGDAFYTFVNKPSHLDYGISDLFTSRDWLTMYDKSLFATMSRIGMLLSFVWDVTINTQDRGVLKKKMEQLQQKPPVPGSARIHNENEKWEAVSPNLQGANLDKIYKLLMQSCTADSGTPEFIFGMGGDVNLATARTMLEPYFMDIRARQRVIKQMMKDQFDYQIWQKKKASIIPEKMDTTYSIMLPEPNAALATEWAGALAQFANAVVILSANGVILEEDAKNVVKMIMRQLGIEIVDDENAPAEEKTTNAKIAAAIAKVNGKKKIQLTNVN